MFGDEWLGAVMRDYTQAYGENWGDFTTNDVQTMTGHPARSFEAFARDVLAPALAQPVRLNVGARTDSR